MDGRPGTMSRSIVSFASQSSIDTETNYIYKKFMAILASNQIYY